MSNVLRHTESTTSGAALDFIKIAAAISMVIDHINLILLDHSVLAMYLVGRASFPLFCFSVACFFLKTAGKNNNYSVRLLFFAVLTEPISILFRDAEQMNVLFTLAASAAFISMMLKQKPWQNNLIFTLGIMFTLVVDHWEFSLTGVLLPMAIYMMLTKQTHGIFWTIILLFTTNLSPIVSSPEITNTPDLIFNLLLTGFSAIFLCPIVILMASRLTLKTRILPKYFLHIFYPAHIAFLGGIAFITNMY